MEDNEVKAKLLALRRAFFELSEVWASVPDRLLHDDERRGDGFLVENYPFTESFDEVNAKVSDWVETHVAVVE